MQEENTTLGQADGAGAGEFASAVERLTAAAESLELAMAKVIRHIESQQQELGAKVDRIVAAIDESSEAARQHLEARIAELERANAELKERSAELAGRAARKTLPPLVTALLAKGGMENASQGAIDPAVLDRTLQALSVEQRIAVKAEMARAGLIE